VESTVGDVPPGSQPGAQAAAAAYLRELLLRPGRYRRRWEQYAERSRRGQVNQLAVAEVLAHYLWEHPRNTGDTDVLPRQLKDTTSRVLSGRLLSKAALSLFMDAFDLSEFERDQLLKLWGGAATIRVLSGPRGMSVELVSEVSAILGPPGHQTVSMHDHVLMGADRQISKIRTLQVIEALREGVDRIPYVFDRNAISVETGLGCSGIAGPFAEIREGVYATHILLAKALEVGETLTLEYWTAFQQAGHQTEDETSYRRVVTRRAENVDIRIQFDTAALPAGVWWTVWDGFEGGIADSQLVELDSQHSAHHYLRLAEKTVVGFHWDW
jgi:hypothetical protein